MDKKIPVTEEVWTYDGSFYGFLTTVYHAFKEKIFPQEILTSDQAVTSLFFARWIETDKPLAQKIFQRLSLRLRKENFDFIINSFYCSLPTKERCLLDAIHLALTQEDLLENHLGHPSILALKQSLKALFSEVHLYTGFVRFQYVGTLLYSKIAPKHYSLPFLCPHFAERYPLEQLMIYDETHKLLAIIDKGNVRLIDDADEPTFNTEQKELQIQENWRKFLASVTINERENKQVQLSHLPKRFRGNMIDFK